MRPWPYYVHMARRWASIVIVPVLIAGIVAYLVSATSPKTYEATATLYVEQPTNPITSVSGGTDVTSSIQVGPTYAQMLNDSSWVLAPEIDRLMATKYGFPGYQFGRTVQSTSVQATQPTDSLSQLIYLSAADTNRRRAAATANAVAAAFVQRITDIESSRYQHDEATLNSQIKAAKANIDRITTEIGKYHFSAAALTSLKVNLSAYQTTYQSLLASAEQFKVVHDSGVTSVSLYAPAPVPNLPIGPHPTRTALIAMVIALLLAGSAVFVYDYVDDTLRSPEEIEEVAGAPILGLIQRFDEHDGQLITETSPRSPAAEAYRLVRTNVEYTGVDTRRRMILVTSAKATEGKSTTASNLANVMSDTGRTVTLVDADLRRPSIQRVFGLAHGVAGLTNLLLSYDQLNGAGMHRSGKSNLVVVPSGPRPPNPADLLSSERMGIVFDHLRSKSDLVVVDGPPVLSVADSTILATKVDGVILVVDPRMTKRRELKQAREAIESVGGKIIGVVINRLSKQASIFGYYYGYYYSSYYQGRTYAEEDTPSRPVLSGK